MNLRQAPAVMMGLFLAMGRLEAASVIAYWPLATNSTEMISGYTTANNGPVTFQTISGVQCAGQFTGVKYFEVTDSTFKTTLSPSAWQIEYDGDLITSGAVEEVVDLQTANGTPPYGLTIYDSIGALFSIFGGPGAQNLASGALTTSTWHHLVTSYDGTTVRQYIDGSLSNSAVFNGSWSTLNNFYVGFDPSSGNLYQGYIANLEVWNGAQCTGSSCTGSTPTVTPTFSFSPTMSFTVSPTPSQSFTFSPTMSFTVSPTPTFSASPTPTPTMVVNKKVRRDLSSKIW